MTTIVRRNEMYILIEKDGEISHIDEMPDHVSWDCWPKCLKIELYSGPDYQILELKKEGWKEVTMR